MTLIFILIVAVIVGTALQIMLDKMLNYKRQAEMHMEWARMQRRANDKLRKKLWEAERDMRSMLVCCDVCLHNLVEKIPDCAADCKECAAEACVCRECSNGRYFTWRGLYETERRSGNDTGGETQDNGGDRKEPPKTVFTAQAGS